MSALRPLSLRKREQFIDRLVRDNMQYTNLRQQLSYMEEFTVPTAENLRKDVFSYVPKTGDVAVGYRIVFKAGTYVAEPWTWLVTNKLKLTGSEINAPVKGAIYYGVIVRPDFVKKYGSNAYSLLLGNLRMLEQNKSRLTSL